MISFRTTPRDLFPLTFFISHPPRPTTLRRSIMHPTLSRTFTRLPTLHAPSLPFQYISLDPTQSLEAHQNVRESVVDALPASPELSPEEMAHIFTGLGTLAAGDERRNVLLKLLGAEEVFGPDGKALP
ncbi:hypothetical protein L202_04432 [Cryptococcus amylolentus CBS 6039]|uniref:Uncharacterized protein n=1 Tax=Cryptococcus amylolentus CBS 6039 TaxID=1295533 RepID=A0A1E3HRD7_9TREE|nr:hypothetical protein L202_04432 [Cryptococcus amylolentus CBS 6039]ODN78904.1 hypothetical protein L202_04432 [Cryptococcus amylolentus CBS 6039]